MSRLPTLAEIRKSKVYNEEVLKRATAHIIQQEADRVVAEITGVRFNGLDDKAYSDATQVIAEGRAIAEKGIHYIVDGMIPDYGMLGMLVAYAKVGKTTMGHSLGACIANGTPFCDRKVQQRRVLIIASEDPPEYTAWVARHLKVEPDMMTFYRSPVLLDDRGLDDLSNAVVKGKYGILLMSSWQAVIRGLIKDENDNAGAVQVIEKVKIATRDCAIPWLIDAHSGRGEDQSDDADPIRALRGASSAAGSADFMLSLRYADGPFDPKRRLSGKGRFVMFESQTIVYDENNGAFESLGTTKNVAVEQVWDMIISTGAITSNPQSANKIGVAAGIGSKGRISGNDMRLVKQALRSRKEVMRTSSELHGKMIELFHIGQAAEVTPTLL
jgi:hypothetical protein